MFELEEYMRTKFKVLDFESDDSYRSVDQASYKDVQAYISDNEDNKEIHAYLGSLFPYQNRTMAEFIKATEEECKDKGLYDLTNTWLDELKEKDLSVEYILKDKSNPELQHTSLKIETRPSRRAKKILIRSLSIAASIALLIGLLIWQNRAPEHERLFAEYHPEPVILNSLTTRSVNSPVILKFEAGLNLYRESKYIEAGNLFHAIYLADTAFGRALYYEAVCLFEAGSYIQSLELLNKVNTRFDEFDLESDWLSALAYIKLDRYEEAVPYLKKTASEENFKQADALRLLERISD